MDRTKEDAFKLFNLRYLPLFAVTLILGIFCVKLSYIVAAIVGIVAILSFVALFLTKSVKWGVAVALIGVLFLGYGAATLDLYLRNQVGLSGNREITCRVIEITEGTADDETTTYYVSADSLRTGGSSYAGGVSFETDMPLAVGDRVTLRGEISIKTLSLQTIYSALEYRKGEKYIVGSATIVSVEAGSPPLSHTIKSKIRETLTSAEGDRAGAFSYAMIFGDAEYMESEDKSAMREVGVAHVFAVSGLHIGVISAAILFLLRKCKVGSGASILILLPIFGFYTYLVGFTPSVLRASIMVVIGLLAATLGQRYDDVSALSLAAILILLGRPLYLFDISFLMSFLSIFGIQSLASPLEKAFLRKNFKGWLAAGLALSISTTVALLPVSAVVFGRISLVGFLLNILVVPLASLAYILTLIALLPTLILPSFGALLGAISILPLVIAELSAAVASLGLATNYAFSTAELLLYYAILAFVGKYSLVKKKVKIVVGVSGGAILAILILAV